MSQWLNLPDPSINFHAALQKRHPKTGRWLLDSQQFASWKAATSSSMWLHGGGESPLKKENDHANTLAQRDVARLS